MKRFIIIMVTFLSFTCFTPLFYASAEEKLVKYDGAIEHFFTHCLIAYPTLAFKMDNPMRKSYADDCITPLEFERALIEMEKNNYILVNLNTCFKKIDGKIYKKTLYLPKNKKPLVLSFDDVVYDSKKQGLGMVDKIVLDENNQLASYTNNTSPHLSYNNEFINILETFINIHPSFSFQNAKAMICLTGYDGILGYKTQKLSPSRNKDLQKVKPVIKKLKDNGWYFACHSYAHRHMKKISLPVISDEISKWKNEVENLIGKTSIYVYPYGEWNLETENIIDEKQNFLMNDFDIFCGVGERPFFSFLKAGNKKVLFMDRSPLDGISFKKNRDCYLRILDVNNVIDPIRNAMFG